VYQELFYANPHEVACFRKKSSRRARSRLSVSYCFRDIKQYTVLVLVYKYSTNSFRARGCTGTVVQVQYTHNERCTVLLQVGQVRRTTYFEVHKQDYILGVYRTGNVLLPGTCTVRCTVRVLVLVLYFVSVLPYLLWSTSTRTRVRVHVLIGLIRTSTRVSRQSDNST
jgi:hypothetical protein